MEYTLKLTKHTFFISFFKKKSDCNKQTYKDHWSGKFSITEIKWVQPWKIEEIVLS